MIGTRLFCDICCSLVDDDNTRVSSIFEESKNESILPDLPRQFDSQPYLCQPQSETALDPRCTLKDTITSHHQTYLGALELTADSYCSSLSPFLFSVSPPSSAFSHPEPSPETGLNTYPNSTPSTLALDNDSVQPAALECPLCPGATREDINYDSGESLCEHSRAEHSRTLYPCLFFNEDGCPAVFRTNRDRNRHHDTRRHSNAPGDSESSLRCVCGKAYFRCDNFVRHVMGCRDRSGKKQRCPCAAEFKQEDKTSYCQHLTRCAIAITLEAARQKRFH